MEILDNRKSASTTFADLNSGDVFIYSNKIYLKLNDNNTDNTFNLNSNCVVFKAEDTPVILVDATLVIE